ncbi:MAG: histidine phosphatase family protein [Deltaproteobacteria bacterium]|nr:histidine phosphatase family protein [Deltaproteobacteria bacterium]MBW2071219.1 histidine phosphatase family protein [Deltaproteobacteria bacterium]
MTKLYLVRHGQTAWNKEEIFRGRADIPLDDTGKKEVHLAGEALKDEALHAVYSSPLSRSMETAENIAKFHDLSVTPLEAIIDISYGQWEGVSNQEVQKKYPDLYKMWLEEPHKVRFPGGESLDEVRSRTMKAIEELLARHAEENIVLVAHRVPNKVICCALIGIDNSNFWRIQQDTACTNLFIFKNNQWIISFLNDTSYLKALGKQPLADF